MQSNGLKLVEVFTDGACKGNPGVGGWGVLLRYQGKEKQLKGASWQTTNNQMELTAVIQALSNLTEPCEVHLTLDSKYVKDGITDWLPKWKKQQWKTANKQPVKNLELWQALDGLLSKHHIRCFWVKGHSQHPENELADRLANQAIDQLLQE